MSCAKDGAPLRPSPLSVTTIFMRKASQARRVVILVIPGALSTAVAGPADIFQAADTFVQRGVPGPRFECSVVGFEAGSVDTFGGLKLDVPAARVRSTPDVILLAAGGVDPSETLHHARQHAARYPAVFQWLARSSGRGTLLAAGCVGTSWLAVTGLLDGKRATTSTIIHRELKEAFPAVDFELSSTVVEDNGVVTAGAAMAYLDLALHIVGKLGTPHLRAAVARALLLDNARRTQALLGTLTHVQTQDAVVARAVDEMVKRPAGGSIASLAKKFRLTERTLQRRFAVAVGVSPREYWQRVRIERGRYLLETQRDTVEQIADTLGFTDASAFYRAFVKRLGVAPGAYRARFRGSGRGQPDRDVVDS